MGIGLGRFHGIAARLGLRPQVVNTVALPGTAGMERGASGAVLKSLAGAALRNLAAEEERWLAWCVVAFGSGIAIYFSLKAEPSPALAAAVGLAGLLFKLCTPKGAGTAMRFLCVLVAAGALGFAAAKLRTVLIDAPAITRDLGPIPLIGRIETVDIKAPNRARIVLAPSKLGDGKIAPPRYVRLTLIGTKAVAAAQPGAVVSALAVLRPPPEPAVPQGYDFARWAYFQGIGAVGFTYGAPKPVEAAPPASLLDRLLGRIESLRLSMTARIAAAIPGPDGSIASALITGERGEIGEEDVQAYRDSGLAHVLSISGVHLALAGLGIFWALRALLALWPRIALTQPIKKWAACAALLSSSFYLAISGGGAPAVRSY
jgi:competence protein ComEC